MLTGRNEFGVWPRNRTHYELDGMFCGYRTNKIFLLRCIDLHSQLHWHSAYMNGVFEILAMSSVNAKYPGETAENRPFLKT